VDALLTLTLMLVLFERILEGKLLYGLEKGILISFLVHMLAFSIVIASFYSLSHDSGLQNFAAASMFAGRFIITWWLAKHLFDDFRKINLFFSGLLFFISLLCVRSIQLILMSQPSITDIRTGSVGLSPNAFADLLVLIFPVLLAMVYRYSRKKTVLPFLVLSGFLLFIGLLLTLSRAGLMGLICGFLIFSITALPKKITVGFLFMSLIAVVLLISSGAVSLERYTTIFDEQFTSNLQRLAIWTSSLETLKHNWFLGVGYFQLYIRSIDWAKFYFAHAHNMFLQFFVEYGIIGFLTLSGIVMYFLVTYIGLLTKKVKSEQWILLNGIGAGITAFLLTQMVSYNLWNQKILYVFLLIFFLFIHWKESSSEKENGLHAR
jgi:O-antigen ligase